MTAEDILTIGAAVVALVQLVKWGGLPPSYGPLAVMAISLMGVVLWGYSEGTFERTQTFEYFAGWIGVATSAAGVFGFIRSGVSGVTAMRNSGE